MSGTTTDVRWLALSLWLRGFGMGLWIVIWPLYVERLGGDPLALGFLATLTGVGGAAAFLPGGWLADRVDRRGLLFWGSLAAAAGPFSFAAAGRWTDLIAGVVLFFGASLTRPAGSALVLDETLPGRLASSYGLVANAFEAGMVLGPPLGVWLAHLTSDRIPFLAGGAVGLASALCLLALRPHPPRARAGAGPTGGAAAGAEPAEGPTAPVGEQPPGQRQPSPRPMVRRRGRGGDGAAAWVALATVLTLAEGVSGPFVVPYWRQVGGLPLETIGWLGSAAMLAAALSGPLWGRLAERVGPRRALAWGLACVAAGWVALADAPSSAAWGLASAAGRGVTEGCQTVAGAELGRRTEPRRAGMAYGLFHVATELGRGAGSLPGGLLFEALPGAPFWLTACLAGSLALWLRGGCLEPGGSRYPRG